MQNLGRTIQKSKEMLDLMLGLTQITSQKALKIYSVAKVINNKSHHNFLVDSSFCIKITSKCIKKSLRGVIPIEKIVQKILVLFLDQENTRKSAMILKFIEEFRED